MPAGSVPTQQKITLGIAILGAVTGTTSFALNAWQVFKYRSRVEVQLVGVYYHGPASAPPATAVALVRYRNLGRTRVHVDTPSLEVSLPDGRFRKRYALGPVVARDVTLDDLEQQAVLYDVGAIVVDAADGTIPDRDVFPDHVRFRLVVPTSVGRYEASASGMTRLAQERFVEFSDAERQWLVAQW